MSVSWERVSMAVPALEALTPEARVVPLAPEYTAHVRLAGRFSLKV